MATIYGISPSPFVRKVLLAHAHKGISAELKTTMPGSDDPEFRKISPLGKIPAYETETGFGFSDSSVIIAYLEKTDSKNSLYPQAAEDYAKALWLEEYADSKMMEATGGLYFQRIVGPRVYQKAADPDRVNALLEVDIPAVIDYLESQLTEDDWLVGNAFSVADIAMTTNLINLYHADFQIDTSRWPKTAAYFQRISAMPIVQAQLVDESLILNP